MARAKQPRVAEPGAEGDVAAAHVAAVRQGLRARQNPQNAGPMQRYMKSSMPCWGVKMPDVKALCKEVFAAHRLPSSEALQSATRALFGEATHREERYAAIELTGHRFYRPFQTPALVPLYEELVVTGAWWDLVDWVAIHRFGPLLLSHPQALRPRIVAYSRSDDLWLRRTAVICQVAAKERTELPLLYEAIGRALGTKEFFLNKAIGWALRAYAAIDPEEVRRFLAERREQLSPLSVREASKHL
jgi:3-methyladenine DNA glycosylase AlkD